MKKLSMAVVASLVLVLVVGAASCGGEPAPFSMQVTPEHMEDTIAGQNCVLLVSVSDEGEGSGKGEDVNMSADVAGAIVSINPQSIAPGQVAEVTVVPTEGNIGKTLNVSIEGERGGFKQTETVTIVVQEQTTPVEELAIVAADMRDKFIPWLETNHPELGITSETDWSGTIVRPNIMVVMYYLFFSEDWEMGLQWHVTIPPYDWTRIYLRDRTTEVSPSYAFEIPSYSEEGPYEAHVIDPPEMVWR